MTRAGPAKATASWKRSHRLQQPEPEAELHVIGAVREAELLGDALLVRLDRLRADEQLLADLGRREAAGDVDEHVALTLGERLVLCALVGVLAALRDLARERARGARLYVAVARGDGAHGIGELAVGRVLHEVARRAGLEKVDEELVLGVHRQDEHP